jgi:hypothetical protein
MSEPQTITDSPRAKDSSLQQNGRLVAPITSAALPPPPTLPAWLEAGLQSGAEHVTILAQRAYRLHAVQVDTPLLMVPLAGLKRLEVDGKQAEVACGEFVMLPRRVPRMPTGLGQCRSHGEW